MEGIIWLALCFGVGYLANKKGRNGVGWGIASLLLSPLICGIIVALLKDNKQAESVAKVEMGQQSLQDRVAADEIKNNQQFQNIEKKINTLESSKDKTMVAGGMTAGHLLDEGMKACPYCGEAIKENAIKCRYCGADIEQVAMKECPYCKEMIRANAVKCKYCRSELVAVPGEQEVGAVVDAAEEKAVLEKTATTDVVEPEAIAATPTAEADTGLVCCPNCRCKVSSKAKYCDNCGCKL